MLHQPSAFFQRLAPGFLYVGPCSSSPGCIAREPFKSRRQLTLPCVNSAELSWTDWSDRFSSSAASSRGTSPLAWLASTRFLSVLRDLELPHLFIASLLCCSHGELTRSTEEPSQRGWCPFAMNSLAC